MFEQSFLKGAPRTRRVGTALISFVSQAILLGVGVLMPLIAFDTAAFPGTLTVYANTTEVPNKLVNTMFVPETNGPP